jgi:hypothetical protein
MVIRVETPLYIAEVDTRGAALASLRLKHYLVAKDHLDWGDLIPALRDVSFLSSILTTPGADANEYVEMVQRDLPAPGMLGLRFGDDAALTEALEQTVFSADRDGIVLTV